MYKNKSKREWVAIAKRNTKSVATGYTVVTAILEFVKEKKSAAGNTYYFCKAQTLNRADVPVQFEDKGGDGESPLKRPRTDDDDGAAAGPPPVHILRPGSSIRFNTFDRTVSSLVTGTVCKISLIADMYRGEVAFKVGSVMTDPDPALNVRLYKKYIQGGPLGEIPTKDNIDTEAQGPDTDPQYYGRAFVLPLSDDTESFTEVSLALDCDDPERFWGKVKEPSKLWPSISDPDTKFVSVNMPSGEKVINTLSVIYTALDGKRTYVKFGFLPKIWECFGITNVDKWTRSAGRLIFNAKDWYAYGSSRLVDIKKMAANAGDDGPSDGYDFGGYGADVEPVMDDGVVQRSDDVEVTSTGFISSMVVNLPDTVRAAGIELPRAYVEEIMARGKYKYTFDTKIQPENPLNVGWMLRLERREKCVFNVTEFDELSRQPFLEDTRALKVKFYGIFPVGDDGPYEYMFGADETKDIVTYAKEHKVTPATIYAVVEE